MKNRSGATGGWIAAVVAAGGLTLALGCGATALPGATQADLAAARQRTPQGAELYEQDCASCHGERGQGLDVNPPVMGETALPLESKDVPRVEFRTAQDLFDYLKAEMPLPEPMIGTLSDEEYWAVTAYLLEASDRSVPSEGLSKENAGQVQVNAE